MKGCNTVLDSVLVQIPKKGSSTGKNQIIESPYLRHLLPIIASGTKPMTSNNRNYHS